MGTVIGYVLIGLLGGSTARAVLPGRRSGSWPAVLTLGATGALLGGLLVRLLVGMGTVSGVNEPGLVGAAVGAVVVLTALGLLRRRSLAW